MRIEQAQTATDIIQNILEDRGVHVTLRLLSDALDGYSEDKTEEHQRHCAIINDQLHKLITACEVFDV